MSRGKHATRPARYIAIERDRAFVLLRARYSRFALPATVTFLGWYFLYVALSAFARGLMDHRVIGNLNVAVFFGVFQFVFAFGVARAYSWYARRKLDPLAAKIREGERSR
jgi:uncharacterized membrane protein (DUF485 family)